MASNRASSACLLAGEDVQLLTRVRKSASGRHPVKHLDGWRSRDYRGYGTAESVPNGRVVCPRTEPMVSSQRNETPVQG
jgi:hypothetical protein